VTATVRSQRRCGSDGTPATTAGVGWLQRQRSRDDIDDGADAATATTTMAWPYAQRAAPARSQAHLAARGWLPSMACATVQNRFAALRDRAGELGMRGGSAPACWSAAVAWPPASYFYSLK